MSLAETHTTLIWPETGVQIQKAHRLTPRYLAMGWQVVTSPPDEDDPPPLAGVREPRNPLPTGPTTSVELDEPTFSDL